MLKVLCVLMLFAGACTMLASITTYRKILRTYLPGKSYAFNRYTSIQIMMVFFLFGYLATLVFYLIDSSAINMSMALIAVIFFFGAIFCYSVVYVQSELLNRLEENASKLQEAFNEAKNANADLERLNGELVNTMNTLKSTESQLVFSEKMSVLGKLMAGIFHEINTPISVIKASTITMQTILDDHFPEILLELRKLSEEDFQDFTQLLKIAVINNNTFTSTSEIRKLKRAANRVLTEAGFDDAIIEFVARNCLLDSDTVESIALKQNSEAFLIVLQLISKMVPVFTSMDCISVSVEKIIKIVSSLKTFSHVSVNDEKAPFNLVSGIETVLVLYVNQLKYSVQVVTDFEEIPQVIGYEDELSQVWSNLIQNAIYAMDELNNTTQGEPRQNVLTISVRGTDDNHVTVAISDNGSGISHEKIKSLFEPFFTTKPTGIGSGLGLSISKQIIEKHGGVINVESEEGVGTTFTVILPVNPYSLH